MQDVTTLMALLQPHLHWHRARCFCFAALVVAVIRLRTVNLAQLAQVINPRRSTPTNYRRLQRFFALFDPDQERLALLLIALRPEPEEPVTLVMDRTEWKFGRKRVNLLVVGYLLEGVTVPLRWIELDRTGNSPLADRIAMIAPLIEHFGADRIKALVADREFIGVKFFGWMIEQQLRFVIRIRKNARMRHLASGSDVRAGDAFASLAQGGRRRLRDKRVIYGHPVYVVAARERDQPWILVTNARPSQALLLYGQRWSIETTFSAFKSRGFDLESTHLRSSERLERLVGVLSLALLWSMKVGQWRHGRCAIKVKPHGRRSVSMFRYGLDYLRERLLRHDWAELRPAFHLLSCT